MTKKEQIFYIMEYAKHLMNRSKRFCNDCVQWTEPKQETTNEISIDTCPDCKIDLDTQPPPF